MAGGAMSDLHSVVETANDIRMSIDSWYKISGQIKRFDDQLRRLSDEHEIWEDKIRKFGRSDDQDLCQKIREAQATLNEEKQKLFGVKGRPRFISKIKLWLFPAKLESSIQKVTTFCDDLSRFNPTTREKEIEAGVRQRALERVPSFSFTSDTRYIPLVEMEEKVKKELRGKHSCILLYGASGTGKSALARNLALHFQQEAKQQKAKQQEAKQQEASGDPLSSSSQLPNASAVLFERVLYLECGPEVSLDVKQREVVELLDPSSSSYVTTDTDGNGKSLSTTSLYSSLLKDKSLLIILDDVWKSEKKPEGVSSKEWSSFLRGMIRHGGNHVKWLITSRSEHLCDQMDMENFICPVGMEPIKSIDARRIFASLTRLRESDILGVQDVMDRIINKIGANLLALTCVASNMNPKRKKDKEEWMRLERELIATLSRNPMEIQGIHGPSYWAAIKFGWESLTLSQQYLLCLMQICSDPSVPSGVIEYFFQKTRQQSCSESFSNARNELEGKQLLTVRRIFTIMSEVEESWSIHDLLKRFIGEVLAASFDSMISTFVEKRSASTLEFDVLINVAYLYFNEDCQKQLANKMADLPTLHLADLQKRIISPITKFLTCVDGEQSTSRLRSSSLQVILKYIKDGTFEEVHTSHLLDSSESQAAMLLALRNSVSEEYHPTIGQQIISTLFTLLERQTAVVAASSPNHDSACDVGGLLPWTSIVLAKSLQQNENKSIPARFTHPDFQTILDRLTSGLLRLDQMNQWCAQALANLATFDDDIRMKMIKVPGLLQNLVIAMERDNFPDCQAEAARALSNLAYNGATALQIVDFSGMLEALRAGLEHARNVQLQKSSAWTVASLANSNDDVRSKIVACEGLVSKLVSSMVEVDNHDVKKQCARALANLPLGGDDMKVKMIKVPGLLQKLVIAMERDNFPDCQAEAARALSNLAGSSATALQVVDSLGVLEALRAGLENTKNVQLQESSAWTVANLAISNEVRSKIMGCAGVFRKLVSLMIEADNHGVNKQCASALANLAFGGDGVLKKMTAIVPEIVDVLADGMAKGDTRTSSGLENRMLALTLLSPTRAKEMELDSAVAYSGRARGELISGLYQECLEDCDRSMASLNETTTENPNALAAKRSIWKWRSCAKAKLGDFRGALADADNLVQMSKETECGLQFALQERGVVKRMMDDFPGALADLDASLLLDEDDYEVLKHRGFVKFLLQDEEGARADAERALRCKPSGVDDSGYGRGFLGGSPVQYLNFELR